jgi:hypothetical protein
LDNAAVFRRRVDLSVIVVVHDMRRELPRTLTSLSVPYQRGIGDLTHEVIVVDNGSPEPVTAGDLAGFDGPLVVHRMEPAPPSPAAAANAGASLARGRNVGIILDGARMVSPGVLAGATRALSLHPRAVAATLAFHLGPDHQSRSVRNGYDAAVEDGLLQQIGWPSDGYRLFEIAALASSNREGFLAPLAESCCTFLPSALLHELGGFDERFDAPGGGLVNHDFFVRACDAPGTELFVLMGEGSFHQVHGGVSSNEPRDRWPEWHAQYVAIRGTEYRIPAKPACYLGYAHPAALRFVRGAG